MLDIIVPVYAKTPQTAEMARESVRTLRETTRSVFTLVAIDNGSTVPLDLDCEVLRLDENAGYAGGVNAGLVLSEGEFICVSSIDVFTPHDWDTQMIATANARRGIASPRARRWMYGVDLGEWEQPDCCYWGGIFVMPRVVYETIGGLDTVNFPLRFSDTDYAVRAARAGFWLGRVARVIVEHRDPSISTLFMNSEAVQAEYERLFERHGQFEPFAWTPESLPV